MDNPRPEVLVVGAGPVGLTMAAELARHGVRARIIDRLAAPSPYCRAIGVSSRTLEVFDDMGIAGQLIDAGLWLEGSRTIVGGSIKDEIRDFSDLPYSQLGVAQYETERVLTRHLSRFGVEIERGITLMTLTQAGDRVEAVLADALGRQTNASFGYVIGCDGAHSAVRRALGIAFEGNAIAVEFILCDVHIDWNVPRGLSVRALRPIPNAPPEMFIAIPLAEKNRYRVTTLAPPELAAKPEGTEHGIQSERPAPGIEPFQKSADAMLPEKAVLGDLRWSSIFRISMRLAAGYRKGNVFIAGDAAHIHPPTGGQGMNTGIQDAYNLAWKLALVMRGRADPGLLDSYESERREVGKDVVASTTQATINLANNTPSTAARLVDTQVLVSYRGGEWVENPTDSTDTSIGPVAGDRVPDCQNLTRVNFNFAFRLFDILRGTEHVLIAGCADQASLESLVELRTQIDTLGLDDLLRLAAIAPADQRWITPPRVPLYIDSKGSFARSFGGPAVMLLVRPDGYLAWRGRDWREPGMSRYLRRVFRLSVTIK